MILHPGVLALLSGSTLVFLFVLYGCYIGWQVITRWDIQDSSEQQLMLERKTYLVSALCNYAFAFEIFSLLLFIFTVEELHPLFVGAMCATGSLNANSIGWLELLVKLIIFFSAGFWLLVNHYDLKTDNYPLVRSKYKLLFLLLPILALNLYLLWSYFLGLAPDIITSCCGSLFSSPTDKVSADLIGLPVKEMILVYYLAATMMATSYLLVLLKKSVCWRYYVTLFSSVFLIVALLSVISFISVYIYELPTHHCPFDMLQKEYMYIGYPIYVSLFGTVFFGMSVGLVQLLRRDRVFLQVTEGADRFLAGWGLIFLIVFVMLVSWPIIFSEFTMKPYF